MFFFPTMRLSRALLELDAIVVDVELTLSSIVQGVALTFLIENTRHALSLGDAVTWLYAVTGLCIIFIFWSRSVLHTLTLIRWPLEFGHNFLYIACTVGECLLFTRLESPTGWFQLSAFYSALVGLLFLYDLRMINVREAERTSAAATELCEMIQRDQRRNIRLLMPVLFLFNFGCACALYWLPGIFIVGKWHIALIAAQLLGLAIYLLYVIRFFARIAPLIHRRQEERRALAEN